MNTTHPWAILALLLALLGIALWVGLALIAPTRERPADIPPTRVLVTTTPIPTLTALPVSAAGGTPASPVPTAPIETILLTPTATLAAPTATVAPTSTSTPRLPTPTAAVQRG